MMKPIVGVANDIQNVTIQTLLANVEESVINLNHVAK